MVSYDRSNRSRQNLFWINWLCENQANVNAADTLFILAHPVLFHPAGESPIELSEPTLPLIVLEDER